MSNVEILLATYNGARYLPDLLRSLEEQTDQTWRILVRDDGSTDETVAVLQAWGVGLGDRFQFVEDGRGNLGAAGNFGALLEASTADYFLPCDQDDFWLSDKVARLTEAIREEEAQVGADCPIIVHADLIVVDENLNLISESFWDFQKIRMLPEKDPWKLITLQNTVTGCAMIGNRALLSKALPVPDGAIVHDWWLALVAALEGHIRRLEDTLVKYRQHDFNTLGSQEWSTSAALFGAVLYPRKALNRLKKVVDEGRQMARAALHAFGGELGPRKVNYLRVVGNEIEIGFVLKKIFLLRHKVFFRGFFKSLALILAF